MIFRFALRRLEFGNTVSCRVDLRRNSPDHAQLQRATRVATWSSSGSTPPARRPAACILR